MAAPPRAWPSGYDLVALDEVDSTSEEAKRRAGQGAPHGTVIWARRQSRGRGRRGRRWESPEGNLYLSLLLRPGVAPGVLGQLSFVAGVAVGEALQAALGDAAAIAYKWPNDILVGDGKVAGILLEAVSEGGAPAASVVVGIGVNVALRPGGLVQAAAALAEFVAPPPLEDLLGAIVADFDRWLGRWRREGFAPVRQAWLARARGVGAAVTVRLAEECLSGTFAALDESGALVLDQADGSRRNIVAGEVFLGPHPGLTLR